MPCLRRALVFAAFASCVSLLFGGSAWAVETVGQVPGPASSMCTPDTFLQTGVASGPSYAVGTGVITAWDFWDGTPIAAGLKLKVGRLSLAGATIVGESAASGQLANQLQQFPARIPVQSGDVIGIHTSGGAGPCSIMTGNASDTFDQLTGDPPPNTTIAGTIGTKFMFPLEAFVEADADGDGFGDETQDYCSTNSTTQGPCRPGSVSFGSQLPGAVSPLQTITLSNTSPSTVLTVSSISASGDFRMVTPIGCGHSIGAGASCQVAVEFAPTGIGPRTGTVSITDAANGSPHTIALTGTGTPTGQRAAALKKCKKKHSKKARKKCRRKAQVLPV